MTTTDINRMVQTLGEGRDKYYVYALCLNDNTPFYIGKGQSRRVFDHAQHAKDAWAYIDEDDSLTDDEKQRRIDELAPKLRTILSAGDAYKPVIIKWGLTQHEAYMCESALINFWGFYDYAHENVGLTNLVNGHASERERASVADIKTKARTTTQFLDECAIAEKSVDNLDARVVFIKINDFYPKCLSAEGAPDMLKVRESVRGTWRIHKSRRSKIQYIFALYHGRVVGIFHVTGVSRSVKEEFRAGARDYPQFPVDTREAEKLCLRYDSINEARAGLSEPEYAKVDVFLSSIKARKKDKTIEEIFNELKGRVYFHVDNNVPPTIRQYMNTIVIKQGSSKEFSGQNPIHYNF